MLTKAKSQVGAVYVEAALVMPILLLVTFASFFFILVAARHFSLQMLANEIAKDVSLSLQPVPDYTETYHSFDAPPQGCIAECMSISQSSGNDPRKPPVNSYLNTRDISQYTQKQFYDYDGCWSFCAKFKYLLVTPDPGNPASQSTSLSANVSVYPTMQFFDEQITDNASNASAGDFFEVTLKYPLRAVWGGGIAFFGLVPDIEISGNAVGVFEKRVDPRNE